MVFIVFDDVIANNAQHYKACIVHVDIHGACCDTIKIKPLHAVN